MAGFFVFLYKSGFSMFRYHSSGFPCESTFSLILLSLSFTLDSLHTAIYHVAVGVGQCQALHTTGGVGRVRGVFGVLRQIEKRDMVGEEAG